MPRAGAPGEAPILTEEQIDSTLADLPEDWVEDRYFYIRVGQAHHHQYEGSDEGFTKRWRDWSEQSDKFDIKVATKDWVSFKGDAKNPVTFATLIQAAEERQEDEIPPDLTDLFGPSTPPTWSSP